MTQPRIPLASPTTLANVDRRRFLRRLAATAGGAALGLGACSGGEFAIGNGASSAPGDTGVTRPVVADLARQVPVAPSGRVLVVIELEGGADGLDMVVPYNDSRYHDLRPNIGLDTSTVLPIDDEIALHPNMANLAALGVATVEGVGLANGDLSHFESSRRWWQGDMSGTNTHSTGFLGRICDELHDGEPVTGVSVGRSSSPALRSNRAVTLAVPDPYSGGWLLSEDDWISSARQGMSTMAGGKSPGLTGTAEGNLAKALDFLDVLADLPELDRDIYPGSDLAYRLSTTAQLLAADVGVRVVHIPWGHFDTHDEHRGTFDYSMMELDEAIGAFIANLDALGLRDRVLVATTSEFGRRPAENSDGTDHGTANSMLLVGPVDLGRYGQLPDLGDLDDEGNLKPTTMLADYYATLAESWFGIPAVDVLVEGTPLL